MTDSPNPSPELKGERPSISSLQLYLDGEGPEFLRREVAEWVESCPETRADYERLQAISLGLRDLPEIAAPDAVKSRVLDRIRDRTRDVDPPATEPAPAPTAVEPLPPSRWSGLLAASVLVGILVGLWFTADQWREWLPNASGPELAKSDGELGAKPGRSGGDARSGIEKTGEWSPTAESEAASNDEPRSAKRAGKPDASRKGMQPDGSVTLSDPNGEPAAGAKPPTPSAPARPVVTRGHPSKISRKDAPHAYYALTVGPTEVSSREWAATLLADLAAGTADDEAVSMLVDFELRRALPDPSDAAYQELRIDVSPEVRVRLDLLAAQNDIGDAAPFAMRSDTTGSSTTTATPSGDKPSKADTADGDTAKKATPKSRDLAETDSPESQAKTRASRGSRKRAGAKPSVTIQTGDDAERSRAEVTPPPKVRVHLRFIAPNQ